MIRTDNMVFDVVEPYSRCIFITVNLEKGQERPADEPLKAL